MTDADDAPLLEVRNLKKYFEQSSNIIDVLLRREIPEIQAVDDVTFELRRNQSISVIGESGCGKTTLLLTLVGLHGVTEGDVYYKGTPFSAFTRADWKEYRSNVQVIFQDPFNSLDPKLTVRESLVEPLKIHGMGDHDRRVREVLEAVELSPPDKYLDRKPVNLSGGEKQRVSIGRALVLEPEVILADEPVSMLDVSTQAAVLNTMRNLVDEFDVAMIYISHDLSTVSYISDLVNVMYLGRIVESAPTERLLAEPKHPYTEALVSAIPVPDPHHGRERTQMSGAPRDPIDIGEGCRFRDRCPAVIPPAGLDVEQPAYREVMDLRERLEAGELTAEAARTQAAAGLDVEEPSPEQVHGWLRDEFDLSVGGEAAAAVDDALGRLVEGDRAGAVETLRDRFESVCERTPAYLEVADDRFVACHLHYDHEAHLEEAHAAPTD